MFEEFARMHPTHNDPTTPSTELVSDRVDEEVDQFIAAVDARIRAAGCIDLDPSEHIVADSVVPQGQGRTYFGHLDSSQGFSGDELSPLL